MLKIAENSSVKAGKIHKLGGLFLLVPERNSRHGTQHCHCAPLRAVFDTQSRRGCRKAVSMAQRRRQPNPIGLDLSSQGVHAVQVETLEGGLRLVAVLSDVQPAESEDDLRSQVGRVVKNQHFLGQRVTTCVPSEALSIQHMQLAAMPEDMVSDAIAAGLEGRLTWSVKDAVIQHLQVASPRSNDGQAEYIVFAMPRGVVEQHLRITEKLGLELVGISALPLAAAHAFSYLGQRRDETDFAFLLVHLAPRITHLLIVQKGELRFARSIRQGVDDMLEAAGKALGRPATALKDEQEFQMRRQEDHLLLSSRLTEAPAAPRHALAVPYDQAGEVLQGYCEEILSCLCYYAGANESQGVDKVVFIGPQANDYDFCQALASRLGLPAQIGDPLAGIQAPGELGGDGLPSPTLEAHHGPARRPKPELAVATGLSLFGGLVN